MAALSSVFPPGYFGNFFLVLVRVGAMIMTAPLIQGRAIPVMLKVGLALLISFLLLPINQGHFVNVPFEWVPLSLLVVKEMGVGVLVGFVANLVFAGAQFAGQVVGMQAGFNLANVIDPLFGQSLPILDQLYTILAGLLFLAIDGHHMLILAVQQTFDIVPIGGLQITGPLFNQLALLTAGVFVAGLRLALPIMAALLLADVTLGLMARSFPQLNIFVVGLPVKLFLAFLLLLVTLPAMSTVLQGFFRSSFVDLSNLLRLVG
ncbi:MAG: flagellar biosynthetic protein FliR [Chloroflexota bacterium]|nr:flagellar biosynthetic protein FliR [Chloroflexota bacterium]